MKRILCLFIVSTLLLIGCSGGGENPPKDLITTVSNTPTPTTKPSILLGRFEPPHYKITRFDVNYDGDSVHLLLSYTFDTELYQYLKREKAEYHFRIHFPETVAQILGTDQTEMIEGPKVQDNGLLSYGVKFTYKPASPLTKEKVKVLKEDMDYQLQVFDAEKQNFHVNNGFRYLFTNVK
ncbi:hypothetical protein NV379_12245 [Paenibacillus sp. N1-5-1-14]|uniref:hypothetical protein n=1 Tax=Paenibacillus radicibacter TaxID=2972488 RepID=UPI0021593F54|nr:hypothetical protein [Paenibacillus radicibacter]MCR8643423.1 hypothetical protein [Paenibacillus radicibacter]